MIKTVLLDRDGVINKDSPDYIKNVSEFEFLPYSLEALKLLNEGGFSCIVISNQSAINRGMTSRSNVEEINARMCREAKQRGGKITDVFYCPHSPEQMCWCRKPAAGLILKAKAEYGINLAYSVMIGDSAKDIEAGKNAGCGYTLLVRTGDIEKAQAALKLKNIKPDYTAENLYGAVEWIFKSQGLRL